MYRTSHAAAMASTAKRPKPSRAPEYVDLQDGATQPVLATDQFLSGEHVSDMDGHVAQAKAPSALSSGDTPRLAAEDIEMFPTSSDSSMPEDMLNFTVRQLMIRMIRFKTNNNLPDSYQITAADTTTIMNQIHVKWPAETCLFTEEEIEGIAKQFHHLNSSRDDRVPQLIRHVSRSDTDVFQQSVLAYAAMLVFRTSTAGDQ